MLAVDVGGTFTDVVSVLEGRIEVTKVPSSRTDPAAPVVEGIRRLGAEGHALFNHASTMGLNAVITRTLPKVGFLTTEGHRDILDRGTVWRELAHEVLGAGIPVSISSETSPLAKEYARASTTVVDVLMKLISARYARRLAEDLGAAGFVGDFNFADCAAMLLPWDEALEKPFRIVFAGPAAGTAASTRLGEAMGDDNLVCCDVGGTSTDISLVVAGRPFVNNTFELEHDLVINALSTEISSVGAGGGSIVTISHSGDVVVGPASAGAEPGPACYGRGGTQPTVTDACLLMGLLDPNDFAGGDLRLDPELSLRAFESLDTNLRMTQRISFAYRIAVANIAEEVTNVAIRHGVDPRDFSLVAFGAAGPMLLPAALDMLHVRRVIVPPHPGLFSALGLLSSDLVYYDSRSAYVTLDSDSAGLVREVFKDMERGLRERSGVGDREGVTVRRSFDGRLHGQTWETPFVEVPPGPIDAGTIPALVERFHESYERRYGNRFPQVEVERVSYRVELVVLSDKIVFGAREGGTGPAPVPCGAAEILHLSDQPLPGARVRPRRACRRCPHRGPGTGPRGPVDHLCVSGAARRGRPLRGTGHRGDSMSGVIPARATPIRELSEHEFLERYRCDRFTATVLASRFGYVVEHVSGRLLTAAFSPILRDFYDFAATISSPPDHGSHTPAMSATILLFTGTMADAVRNTVDEYGVARLEPGDVIVSNDPYRNGTHVNDMLFVRPVFHDGRLACFVNIKAHQLDMGGVVPGGFSVNKRNVYENGLVLSPRALFHADRPVQETWTLIFDNVRFGEMLAPDMLTIAAELARGERLLRETIERYGLDAVHGAMTYVCDASAERMTAGLAAMPDGVWSGEDIVDCDAEADDEEYRVRVTVSKRGDRAEVDFSGTSRQARTCINATPLDVKTVVGIALKYLFDPQGCFTSGTWRPIDVVLPEGTVISALPPDGAVLAYWEQSNAMLSALLRALAPAVGEAAIAGDRGGAELHNASGVRPDGTQWISAAQVGGEIGPFGANRFGDGDSQMISYLANGIAPAVEAIESESPVMVLRHEIVPDSRGPGTHRGGASLLRDSLWLTPARHQVMALRYKRAPGFGVCGGVDGRTGGVWIWDPGKAQSHEGATPVGGVLDPGTNAPGRAGLYHYPYRVPHWDTPADGLLRYINNAGGGWGDPFERDPELVKRDVRDGYVTIAGAAADYGVVVVGDPDTDPEGIVVDNDATGRLRTARSH